MPLGTSSGGFFFGGKSRDRTCLRQRPRALGLTQLDLGTNQIDLRLMAAGAEPGPGQFANPSAGTSRTGELGAETERRLL
jgi:hypothetical protein